MEIGAPRLELLAAQAAAAYHRREANIERDQRKLHLEEEDLWLRQVERMKAQHGMKMIQPGAQSSHGVYHFQADASGHYLIFDLSRGT